MMWAGSRFLGPPPAPVGGRPSDLAEVTSVERTEDENVASAQGGPSRTPNAKGNSRSVQGLAPSSDIAACPPPILEASHRTSGQLDARPFFPASSGDATLAPVVSPPSPPLKTTFAPTASLGGCVHHDNLDDLPSRTHSDFTPSCPPIPEGDEALVGRDVLKPVEQGLAAPMAQDDEMMDALTPQVIQNSLRVFEQPSAEQMADYSFTSPMGDGESEIMEAHQLSSGGAEGVSISGASRREEEAQVNDTPSDSNTPRDADDPMLLSQAYLSKFPKFVLLPPQRDDASKAGVHEGQMKDSDPVPGSRGDQTLVDVTVLGLLNKLQETGRAPTELADSDKALPAPDPPGGSGQVSDESSVSIMKSGLGDDTVLATTPAAAPEVSPLQETLTVTPDLVASADGLPTLSADSGHTVSSTGNLGQTNRATSMGVNVPNEQMKRNYSRKLRVNKDDYLTNFRSPIHASYVIKAKLGTGSWGAVHLAIERSSGYLRAIKKIPKRSSVDLKRFRQEMTILKGFDHPRIVRLYETFEDFANLYMVMEYCKGGELFERMIDEGPMPEPIAAWLMKQILSSVAYCHTKGVCHRDLKPENFLFMERDIRSPLKLLDFGLAKRISKDDKMSSAVGTIYYLAPELLTGSYDRSVDCWSAGIIMYVLLYGAPPFQADTDAAVLRMIRDGNIDYTSRPVSNLAKHLIRGLCNRDPHRRLAAKDALGHQWFKTQWPSPLLNIRSLIRLSPTSASQHGSTASLPSSAGTPDASSNPATSSDAGTNVNTAVTNLDESQEQAECPVGRPSLLLLSPQSATPQRDTITTPSGIPLEHAASSVLPRVTTYPTRLGGKSIDPSSSVISLPQLVSINDNGGADSYCCDFAELQCGHSKKCSRASLTLFPPGTNAANAKLWQRRREAEPPDQIDAEEPHFAGALTHLKKLGLQNPEEAAQLADRLVEKWRHYASLTPLKRAILSLAAQQLEHAREFSYIRAIFDLLDTGGDGFLTTSELTQSLTTLRSFNPLSGAESLNGGPGTPMCKTPPMDDIEFASEVGLLADYVDLDGNGQIEYSEFAAACLDASTYKNPSAGRAIFRMLDRDGDGRIGQGELRSVLGWNDPSLTAPSEDKFTGRATHGGSDEGQRDRDLIEQLVAEADLDGDGFIGSQDFQQLLEGDEEFDDPNSRLYDAADLLLPSTVHQMDGDGRDQFDFSEITRKMSSCAAGRQLSSKNMSSICTALAVDGFGGEKKTHQGTFTEEAMAEMREMKLEKMRNEMQKSLRNQYSELDDPPR